MACGCTYRIILHHRQEGQLLTQDQEEYILIGGLALTWIGACFGDITPLRLPADCSLLTMLTVIVTSWRAFGSGGSGGGGFGGSSRSGGSWGSAPKGGKGGPWDDYVVEEYYDWY